MFCEMGIAASYFEFVLLLFGKEFFYTVNYMYLNICTNSYTHRYILLGSYVLGISKIISGWASTCNSIHIWWFYGATQATNISNPIPHSVTLF